MRWIWMSFVAVGWVCMGCGATPGDTENLDSVDADDVAEVAQAITPGTVVTNQYSGHVALEVWSSSLGAYVTFCSGTLIRNRYVVTAKHCFNDDVTSRTMYARMGSQVRPGNPFRHLLLSLTPDT